MTNAQILSAVLAKWIEPIVPALANTAINGMSSNLLPLEKFMKNWGLVRNEWSVAQEIQSLLSVGSSNMMRPFIESAVSKIPDKMIPSIAHNYVDNAIAKGSLALFDERIVLEREDLVELKKYLDCNLPYSASKEEYIVKIPSEEKKDPKSDGKSSDN